MNKAKVTLCTLSRTFEKDTVVFFDRTEFNLKGYDYYIEIDDNICVLEIHELSKLKEELGEKLFSYALDGTDNRVAFSEEDFEETFNPFEVKSWLNQKT